MITNLFDNVAIKIIKRQIKSDVVIEFTEDEKFAICAAMGCDVSFSMNDNILHYKTEYPCAVSWNGRKFLIAQSIRRTG